jgi:hypothetical protein
MVPRWVLRWPIVPPNALNYDLADPEYHAAVVDLLGVLAYGELSAAERMAADATLAPTLADEMRMVRMATTEFSHFAALRDRLTTLGADPLVAMEPFRAPLIAFHEHTAPRDWWESLIKVYVGDGIGLDFYREIAAYVDPQTRDLVLEVCADLDQSQYVIDRVTAAIAEEPALGGRLALWGRRLVGEALSQAQRVAAERDALATLLVGGVDRPGADLGEIGRMLARLTDEHSRRMQSLGLTA